MSGQHDSRKRGQEALDLGRFLAHTGYTLDMSADPNGHDAWACKNGRRILALEHTLYTVGGTESGGSPQMAAVRDWDSHLWPKIDTLRRTHPELRNVGTTISFGFGPPPKRYSQLAFCTEFVDMVAWAWSERDRPPTIRGMATVPVTIVHVERDPAGTSPFRENERSRLVLERCRWPAVAACAKDVLLMRVKRPWPEWCGPDMQGGSPVPDPSDFARIVRDKERKAKRYNTQGLPLCLVIVCGLFQDIRTQILDPRDRLRVRCIRDAFGNSGFNPGCTMFAEIWLYHRAYGYKLRLHPPGQRTCRTRG